MTIPGQLAKGIRDVHFGGNWTSVNLRDQLADVTWEQATTRVESFHTIAELVFHMNYFVEATIKVLKGGSLEASDKLSFNCPVIALENEWQSFLSKTWADAEELAVEVERLSADQLAEIFVKPEYGTYYRCLQGLVEHCHYHLGQISLLKRLL